MSKLMLAIWLLSIAMSSARAWAQPIIVEVGGVVVQQVGSGDDIMLNVGRSALMF